MYICIGISVCIYVLFMYVCMYVCMCVYVCVYVCCIHICMYVCMMSFNLLQTYHFWISLLRIDNSRRGAMHVLCDISRTKIAITSCYKSNERAYFSACVDANGILMKFDLKKRHF